MKILLLLAIFCAVSFASSIKPKWTITKSDSRFQVTEVIAESAPARGEYNTINICANAGFIVDYLTGFYFTIGANYGTPDNIVYEEGYVRNLGDSSLKYSVLCQFFSFRVPPFAESSFYVTLYFSATENYMSEVKIDFDI